MRTLRLNVVPLQGDDVAAVQVALGVHVDGIFGVRTAAQVRSWKWKSGERRRFVDETMAPADQRRLLGEEPSSRAHLKRAAKRRKALEYSFDGRAGLAVRVAPGYEFANRAEVVLGAAEPDDHVAGAGRDIVVGSVEFARIGERH